MTSTNVSLQRGFLRGSAAWARPLSAITGLFCVLFLAAAPLAAQWDEGPGEVPYVPTPQNVVEEMLKLGKVAKGDMVYDLGCGDGRIVVTAAEKFHARGTGVDINPVRIKEAEENARKAGVADQVRFVESDLFKADIHDATVVTLYLLPDVNLRLRPKLLKDLRDGTRIVSHSFDMGEWQPEKKIEVDGRSLYLWIVTEKARQAYGKAAE
jgi:SAM-dependent methyltransferase